MKFNDIIEFIKPININGIAERIFDKMEDTSKKYKASPDFIYRKMADLDVLISVGSNIADFNGYIEMNETAAVMWKALQNSCDVNELADTVVNTYSISREEAFMDAQDFLEELKKNHMVMEL